jgi:hypothetical protein
VERNTLIRAGGNAYDMPHGSLKFHADERNMAGFVVRDLVIEDATHFGIQVQGPHAVDGVTLEGIEIRGAGWSGIHLNFNANGSGRANRVTVAGAPNGLTTDDGGWFAFDYGAGNTGW